MAEEGKKEAIRIYLENRFGSDFDKPPGGVCLVKA
jgi:hypothetical protein